MNNEFEDFDRALSQATSDLGAWDSGLLKNVKLINQSTDAKKIAAETLKDEEDRRKALTAQASATVKQLGSFAKTLADNGGSFEPLAQAIDLASEAIDGIASAFGPVGAIVGSLFNAAGKTTSFLIRAMDKAYGTFEKLSQTGVVTSFSDMQTQAAAAGLNLDDFQKIFSKNSKDLALIGGTATTGTKEIANLGTYSNQLRIQMQRLGISSSDMIDLQTSALTQQARAQGSMIKTNSDSVRITDEYISNLSAVSKLTGMSIKQLDDFNKQLQNSVEYRLGIQNDKSITAEGQKAIKFMLQSAQSADPALEKILEEAVVTKGAMRTSEGSQFASMMGDKWPAFQRMINDMREGKIGGADATGKLARDMEIQMKEVQQRVSQNKNDPLYKQVTGILNFIDANRTRTQKQYNEQLAAVQAQKNKTDDLNSAMADTKSEMYRASQQMEQLATNSDIVASLMDSMAETMKDLTGAAYKMTGKEKPESIKIQDEIVSLRKDLASAKTAVGIQEDYNKNNPGELGTEFLMNRKRKQVRELEEKIAKAKQKQIDAEIKEGMRQNTELERQNSAGIPTSGAAPAGATSAGTPPSGAAPTGDTSASGMIGGPKDPKAYAGLNIGGSYPGEAIAGGPSSAKLIGIARQMQAAYPGGVFNAFNDSFAGHKNSPHSKGLAFDYSLPGYPRGKKIPPQMGQQILAQLRGWGASYGIDEYNNPSGGATGGHIHAQVSARTGGILSGPNSGYLAELHGDEMVIPSETGVAKQALNSSTLQADTNSSEITSLYKSLGTKMNRLVNLMESSVSNDKKHLRSSKA